MGGPYDFGPGFERSVIRLCMEDRAFLASYSDTLDPVYFSDPGLMDVCLGIVRYWGHFRSVPRPESLVQFMEEEGIGDGGIAPILDACAREKNHDLAFVSSRVVAFARQKAMEDAILQGSELLSDGRYEEIRNLVSNALAVGDRNKQDAYDYFGETIDRFKSYGLEKKMGKVIPTGIVSLDEVLDEGGLGNGELGLVQAPPNAGKTAFLVNVGYAALAQGKKVTHFTLEVSDVKLARRYDMRITGMSKSDLMKKKRTAASTVLKLAEELGSGLDIKGFPADTANVGDLASYLEVRRDVGGFVPDLIIVDYGEILAPSRRLEDKWNEIGESYTALRALGRQWDCPLWTGSQTNRSGIGERITDMRHTGGSFEKNKVADVVLSLGVEERARPRVPMVVKVIKNREAPKDMEIACVFEKTTQRISERE